VVGTGIDIRAHEYTEDADDPRMITVTTPIELLVLSDNYDLTAEQ
jgi:hypothetical protein